MPARLDEEITNRAREIASKIIEKLDYVGVLCTELFVLSDGRLVVNELAPRPHNSGHATIDACICSQYEQQVRAMANLPLGDTTQVSKSVMLNLLGDLWFDENETSVNRIGAKYWTSRVSNCIFTVRSSRGMHVNGPHHLFSRHGRGSDV